MLDSGYITNLKDNIYKVPNYEVYSYFFEKISPFWLKKHFPKLNIDSFKNSFENTEEFGKTFQEEPFDKLIYRNFSENYFKVMATLPFYTHDQINNKHKKYIEQHPIERKGIDILLTLNLTISYVHTIYK